jgi:hypothetical protein
MQFVLTAQIADQHSSTTAVDLNSTASSLTLLLLL